MRPQQALFDKLVIIGVGLMGGSVGLAAKQAGVARDVVGIDNNPEHLQQAMQLYAIDSGASSYQGMIEDADFIVIASHISSMDEVFSQLKPLISEDVTIVDLGSVKTAVMKSARRYLGDAIYQYVPCHPIAGREKSGPQAALASLFQDKSILITPDDDVGAFHLDRAMQFWQALGGHVDTIDPVIHDSLLAATSHLPQIISYALVNAVLDNTKELPVEHFIGTGFEDTTRLASSNPVMWADICKANKKPILEQINHYKDTLSTIASAIEAGDRDALLAMFTTANKLREH